MSVTLVMGLIRINMRHAKKYTQDINAFNLSCIMREDKLYSFNLKDRKAINDSDKIIMSDIKIKNADNPAQLLNAKLITIEVKR